MDSLSLFAGGEQASTEDALTTITATQYFPTPGWFSEALFERCIAPLLRDDSVVIEPTAGDGALLRTIPRDVRAFGVEIDPVLAAEAAATSGHPVITGDVLKVAFPATPSIAFANPPFSLTFVEQLLQRLYSQFGEGGTACMILPAYMLQTSRTVERLARCWSIDAFMVPRDLFSGLSKPLIVASFTRSYERRLVGLAFFLETAAWQRMPERFHQILSRARTNVWVAAILAALQQLGGTGTVEQITRIVSGAPPTDARFPRESIRKWLRLAFEQVAPATYTIPQSTAA